MTVLEEAIEGWWLKLGCLDRVNRWDNSSGNMEATLFDMLRCSFLESQPSVQRGHQKSWICLYLDSSKEMQV